MDYNALIEAYRAKYTTEPRIFRAPGRINIIGEHTDYNDGFVLPAAIDREIGFLIGLNHTNRIRLYSLDMDQGISFTLDSYQSLDTDWAQYVIGIIDQLQQKGISVPGFDCVIGGDIPLGAGLSSSAALECATLTALNTVFDLHLDQRTVAQMAQKAENEYVGVNCGIMDQFASVFGQQNHCLKIDCRSLEYKTYPLALNGYQLVLVDSLVKHSLASSEYNTRRAECEEGVSLLQKHYPEVKALRDVSPEMVTKHQEEFRPEVYRRCKYITEENQRVTQACEALVSHDLTTLGNLLYATHHGLQHEFEISCPELDFLVDFTRPRTEILGARMMGGGFGGCSINLVANEAADQFCADVKAAYAEKFGQEPAIYQVQTAHGASEITEHVMHHV